MGIVENAVETAQKDTNNAIKQKESEMKQEMRDLEKLFHLMDTDGSGTLTWDEFKESFEIEAVSTKWKLLDFRPQECAELFGLLDDGDGEIETKEFFAGLQRMRGMALAKDVFRLQKSINKIHDAVQDMVEARSNVANGLSEIPKFPSQTMRTRFFSKVLQTEQTEGA